MANPTWTLQGTLTNASGQPVVGAEIVVQPPGMPYNTPWGSVVVDPAKTTSKADGSFALQISSIAGCSWSIKIGDKADSVLIPDPGPNAIVGVSLITPAYVPQWQNGKKIAQGVGISGISFDEDSKLVFSLNNGTTLPPLDVPSLTHDVQSVAGKQGNVTLVSADITDGAERWDVPAQSMISEKSLASFRKAAAEGTARVVVMGGSSAEGQGVTALTKRWQDGLRDKLRSALGLTANTGYGYIPARYATGGLFPAPRVLGTEGVDYSYSVHSGFGNRSVELKTNGVSITYPAQDVRYLTIHWLASSAKAGAFKVQVDSKSPFTINTAGGADTERSLTVDLGMTVNRQVTVTWISGNPVFEGLSFDTATTGISWRDATHGGYLLKQMVNGSGSDPQMVALGMKAITEYDPHLVVVGLSMDEMADAYSTSTIATWKTNLGDLVSKIRAAAPKAGVLLIMEPMRPEDARSAAEGDTPKKLAAYQLAAQQVAAAKSSTSVLLLSSLWQPINTTVQNPAFPTEQDPVGWLSSRRLPSDVGSAAISSYVARYIAGGVFIDRIAALDQQVAAIASREGMAQDYVLSDQIDSKVSALIASGGLTRNQGDARWVEQSDLDRQMTNAMTAPTTSSKAALDSTYVPREAFTSMALAAASGDVRTSINLAPARLAQIAIVSGVIYMASGTTSPADWKQIS